MRNCRTGQVGDLPHSAETSAAVPAPRRAEARRQGGSLDPTGAKPAEE
jgi:hypothetical protein